MNTSTIFSSQSWPKYDWWTCAVCYIHTHTPIPNILICTPTGSEVIYLQAIDWNCLCLWGNTLSKGNGLPWVLCSNHDKRICSCLKGRRPGVSSDYEALLMRKKVQCESLDLHRLLAWVQHNSCCYATMQHLMTSFCNIWWHHYVLLAHFAFWTYKLKKNHFWSCT